MPRSILIDFIAYHICIDAGYKKPYRTKCYKKLTEELGLETDERLHELYAKFVSEE